MVVRGKSLQIRNIASFIVFSTTRTKNEKKQQLKKMHEKLNGKQSGEQKRETHNV
jgi:hypothetical protein